MEAAFDSDMVPDTVDSPEPQNSISFPSMPKIRVDFPEAWMWEDFKWYDHRHWQFFVLCLELCSRLKVEAREPLMTCFDVCSITLDGHE
jgi:hypothetical protein